MLRQLQATEAGYTKQSVQNLFANVSHQILMLVTKILVSVTKILMLVTKMRVKKSKVVYQNVPH